MILSAAEARECTRFAIAEDTRRKEKEIIDQGDIIPLEEVEEYIRKYTQAGQGSCAFAGTLTPEDVSTLKGLGYAIRCYKATSYDIKPMIRTERVKKYIFWGPEEVYNHRFYEKFTYYTYYTAISWTGDWGYSDDCGELFMEY